MRVRAWWTATPWPGVVLIIGAIVSIVGCFLPFVALTGDRTFVGETGFGAYMQIAAAVLFLVGTIAGLATQHSRGTPE